MQWNADFTSIPLKHMFVSSPLDDLINHLGGPGKVAEMKGRRGRVVKTDKQPQPHYEARESDSSNVDSLNIQEVSKMIRTKSCAVFRINLITVISIDVILGQDPGAGSQVENFRRTTRRTVSADLTDCPWVSEDELCLCPLHLKTGPSFQREKDSLVLAFVSCSWDYKFSSVVQP